jgi:reductive dehalogenase
MKLFSYKNRQPHLGPYPLERLKRGDTAPTYRRETPLESMVFANSSNPHSLANAMVDYMDLLDRQREGEVTPRKAPIPDDPEERARHFKAACYYLDASQVGVCALPKEAILAEPIRNASLDHAEEKKYAVGSTDNAMSASIAAKGATTWQRTELDDPGIVHHTYALVLLTAYTREPNAETEGENWIAGTQAQRAALRAAEVAVVIAQYLRMLGIEARAHTATTSDVDPAPLLLASGLGEIAGGTNGSEMVANPYLGRRFGVAVITTTLEMTPDRPLAKRTLAQRLRSHGLGWWLGVDGTRSGRQGEDYKDRAFHLGLFPMEKIKRVAEPTILIDTPNVPRLPKRHDMFVRAAIGDLGKKAERAMVDFRMNRRAPIAHAMMVLLGGLVPLQYGKEAAKKSAGTENSVDNSKSVKGALHYLGADITGICEIPEYAWYSHDHDGSEIKPYHKYAISVLINQGHETMDGASGDDWIGSAQGMRSYMRTSLVCGIVAQHIRNLGYSARTHTVIDQDVLHIPLILKAGLGETGRIGEVMVNPFIGPSTKSTVITTNMPLDVDLPIDFGLQDFCSSCLKCARECPCTAIPTGDKIMFNGYEIWKPDIDKCSRYRATNAGGTMCGRCTKTCPWNLEGVMAEKPFLWSAINLPFTRKWLAKLDDKVGNGEINPVKKWWWDLDTDEDNNIVLGARTNARMLSFRAPIDPEKQVLACYPAEDAPPPEKDKVFPVDRKKGIVRYQQAESPDDYRAR